MEYRDYLKSDDWKNKKKIKYAKKERSCEICCSKNNLELHHALYKNLFDVEQKDLIVLCHRCHDLGHKLKHNWYPRVKNKNSTWSNFGCMKACVRRHLGFHIGIAAWKVRDGIVKIPEKTKLDLIY